MKPLSAKDLKKFLKLAGDHLSGKWVLIGGSVLPALGIDYRSTIDIDVSEIGKNNHAQTLKLMELAEKMKMPIESINQAGSFFLRRIPGYQKKLILLSKGKKATFYRPNLELYIQLKISRMSDSDLADCMKYWEYTQKTNESCDLKKIKIILDSEIKNAADTAKKKRLSALRALFPIL